MVMVSPRLLCITFTLTHQPAMLIVLQCKAFWSMPSKHAVRPRTFKYLWYKLLLIIMTLTVKIGRIGAPSDNCLESIDECPQATFDVCDPEYTIYPRRAYRSGFYEFFDICLPSIYRKIATHPENAVPIIPLIDEINALPDTCVCNDVATDDRMKWFKFWCNHAVELYADEAGIEFC